jgi:hypothetical protein
VRLTTETGNMRERLGRGGGRRKAWLGKTPFAWMLQGVELRTPDEWFSSIYCSRVCAII